ncbi:hypothetical protein [Variovorax fucosicus]
MQVDPQRIHGLHMVQILRRNSPTHQSAFHGLRQNLPRQRRS